MQSGNVSIFKIKGILHKTEEFMKKAILFMMSLLFTLGCTGCGPKDEGTSSSTDTTASSNDASTSSKDETRLPLTGKTFVFLGSSIVAGYSGYSMCEYLTENYGCEIVKIAKASTWLVDREGYNDSYVQRFNNMLSYIEDCDHFVCQLSTNGAGSLVIGEVSMSYDPADFDTTTLIGAIEYITATARETWKCPVSFFSCVNKQSQGYTRCVEALYEVQEKWDIGILDLYNDEEFNDISEEQRAVYLREDGVHPTHKGYEEWYTPKFAEYLLKY